MKIIHQVHRCGLREGFKSPRRQSIAVFHNKVLEAFREKRFEFIYVRDRKSRREKPLQSLMRIVPTSRDELVASSSNEIQVRPTFRRIVQGSSGPWIFPHTSWPLAGLLSSGLSASLPYQTPRLGVGPGAWWIRIPDVLSRQSSIFFLLRRRSSGVR